MKWIVAAIVMSLCIGCSGPKEADDEGSGKKLDPKYQALIEQFGNAIANKNYKAAYDLTSPNLRKKLTFEQFVETWKPYRDSFSGEVETEYTASEDDPKEMEEFVPQADRAHLVEEVTIEFGGLIDEEESEFFCTTWIIDDGNPSIASFYVED